MMSDLRMLVNFIERVKRLGALFQLCVVVPTLCAVLYFGLFASDIYLSESQFVVRNPQKPAASGLGLFLQSSGIGSGDEIFSAESYAKSRDALTELNKDQLVTRAYTRPTISIFDRYNSLGWQRTFEDLFKYFDKRVLIEHESSSSITKLTVQAYTADDAYRINERLLRLSEALVNRLNVRARADLIRFAEVDVRDAERKAAAAAIALSSYRNAKGVIDPERQAAVQLQMVSKLQDELIATKTQISELRTYAPQNPQVPVLETRARQLAGEINQQQGLVAGGRRSLSSAVASYQRVQLQSQFSDRQLALALASLEAARNEARRKQSYVERIVQPNRPDKALEPRRFRSILATFILGMVVWGVLSLLIAGIREHNG